MPLPWKEFTALSALLTYTLVGHRPDFVPYSNPSYLGTFIIIWFLHFAHWSLYKVIVWPKFLSPLRHLPAPTGGSWWNGQWNRITSEPSGLPMRSWVNEIPNKGLIRYLGLFNSERIIITDPKGLGEVLTTKNYDFIKPTQFTAGIGRLLGFGILLAEGDEHKMQRKNLMPAFAFRHVKDLYPVFWKKSVEAATAMTENIRAGGASQEEMYDVVRNTDIGPDEAVIEAGDWGSRATLDIIGVTGLGKDFGAIKDPNNRLNVTYRTVFKPSKGAAFLGMLNLLLPGWFVRNLPVKRNGEVEACVKVIRAECLSLIRDKKARMEKGKLEDLDILSVALESGAFSDDNLVDQLMTFLAAGHETTATAMTWAIYMLCLNPKMQNFLRKEIREHLPSLDEVDPQITSQDIDNLPYLNAVCSEVLRYYSPVPLTLRVAAVDTSILGQPIPKGTRIMIVPWATNRQESLWGPTHDKFDPSRWLKTDNGQQQANTNGGAKSNYAFLTFLHGPRSCIGQNFARGEFAALLATWVGRFEFQLNNEDEVDEKLLDVKGGVTAKPSKGLYVRARIVPGW